MQCLIMVSADGVILGWGPLMTVLTCEVCSVGLVVDMTLQWRARLCGMLLIVIIERLSVIVRLVTRPSVFGLLRR